MSDEQKKKPNYIELTIFGTLLLGFVGLILIVTGISNGNKVISKIGFWLTVPNILVMLVILLIIVPIILVAKIRSRHKPPSDTP